MNLAQNIITNILTEKASIDWNNFLTPEEVEKFLSKDDKVESAEEIIYNSKGNFYNKYFKDLKDRGWHKMDLVQDLVSFYENNHLNESIFSNNKNIKSIQPYLKTIQNSLLPSLSKYEIFINSNPTDVKLTEATYSGEADGDRLVIKFYSNSNQLADYSKSDNVVYCNVYLGAGGTPAGILNLSNVQESAEQIYATLYELGFRTNNDKEEDKLEKEKKAAEEKAKKQADKEKRLQNQDIDNVEKEPEEEIDPKQESQESIEEASIKFDKYLNELIKIGEMNSTISCKITMDSDRSSSFRMLNIDMIYISPTICLLETTGIKPKVDKTVTWQTAKDYCIKVAEKVNGFMSIDAMDNKGADIELNDTDDSNDLDLNIDI